jgi:uncharacterized protein DUF2628
MKTFKVYKHPTRGLEAVKVGFSWPGFLFGIFWMLLKKLWAMALLWFGLYFVCNVVNTVAGQSEESGAQALVYLFLAAGYVALNLIPGFKGNQWRETNLTKRGFALVGTVQTETPDAAIAQVVSAPAPKITQS